MRTLIALLLWFTFAGGAQAAMPPLWMLARSMPADLLPTTALPPTALPPAGAGAGAALASGPGQQCRAAIDMAERQAGIPPHLMAAIGRIESGRRSETGEVDPWPWSINAEGIDHVYGTEYEAIAAVRALQAQGVRSIDVGCMQVNLQFHPDAFASLQDAFDPMRNAAYAARFLTTLRAQTGNWETATAWYHSATPELGADYQRKVMAVLPEERQHPPAGPLLASNAASGLAPPIGSVRGAFMLSNHVGPVRLLPMAVGTVGRGLAAYRANPVPIASRVALR